MTQANPIQLKCPICQAMISVAADHAGQRIACDQCGSKIKVPGQVAQTNDDDDWFNLESDIKPAVVNNRKTQSPELGDVDDFMLPDLKDVPLSPLTVPRPAAPPPLSESDLEALSGFADSEDQKPAPLKLVQPQVSADDSFRVACPTCESISYAKPNQVGKRIRCHDCHAPIVVPPPPKAKPKYQVDIQAASTFNFKDGGEENLPDRPADPLRKSADDLLRAAEASEMEKEQEEWELPDFQQWFSGLAKVFLDPVVGLHIFFLSLMAFLPTAVALQMPENQSSVIVMGLFAGGAIFGALVIANGFAILQSVANGEGKVSEWPLFDPMAWLGQLIIAVAAVGVAAGPIWAITNFFFQGGLITVATSMISLYLLYPIVLLSMLDEESILVPFSTDVTKSVMRAPDQWGAAYLASGVLFFGMFLMFMIASVSSPITGAGLAIIVTVAGAFAYFGILGRLAYGIGHSINAPPMVNDIQRSTKRKEEEL